MKAIFEYDLSDMDEERRALLCMHAQDMGLILWELISNTRKHMEFEIENGMNAYEAVDYIIAKINADLEERGVNLDRLIT